MGVLPRFVEEVFLLFEVAQYSGISYYGSNISNKRFDNQYVLPALKKVELPTVSGNQCILWKQIFCGWSICWKNSLATMFCWV